MNEVMILGYYCWFERYVKKYFRYDFKRHTGLYRYTLFKDENVIEDIQSELMVKFLDTVSKDRRLKEIRTTKQGDDDKRFKEYREVKHPWTYFRRMLNKLLYNIIDSRIKNFKRYKRMNDRILEKLESTEYFDFRPVFEFKYIINTSGLTIDEENVINSYFVNERNLRQIAENSGISYETVRKRFQRAKAKIRKVLIKEYHNKFYS